MWLFALCILSNVLIGVIFKLFGKFKIENLQAIIVNYFVCFTVGSITLGKIALPENFLSQPWFAYALFLSALFIIGFNITAQTFQNFGIGFTTIVQKISLVMSVIAAIILYNESSGNQKLVGILFAFLAIILINFKDAQKKEILRNNSKWIFLLPLFTFLISGIIEITLLVVQKENILLDADIEFVSMLFGMAGIIGVVFFAIKSILIKKIEFGTRHVIGGVCLGIPNFFSIYLLVLLLGKYEGSVVFPINNVGILGFSALIGLLFFSEKFSVYKWFGLGFALGSIYLISNGG